MNEPSVDSVRDVIDEGLAYLRKLNPHLWKQGASFPGDSGLMGTLYADGELIMNMGYESPEPLVKQGLLPGTTRSFVFDTGTVGNTNFMAIAVNASNIPAALVAINEMLSPEMQYSAYEALGTLTVLDLDKLSDEQRLRFDSKELGAAELPVGEFLSYRIAEPAGPVIPIIEQLWRDEVVGK